MIDDAFLCVPLSDLEPVCVCPSQDLIAALLPLVLPAVTEGLQDLDDDVRAVAASALIPVVEGMVQLLPKEVRTTVYLIELVWIRSFLLPGRIFKQWHSCLGGRYLKHASRSELSFDRC